MRVKKAAALALCAFCGNRRANVDLIIFGDSISDIGNTWSFSQGGWPAASSYPAHVFSNEETWPTRAAAALSRGRGHPGANLFNYGIGGATVDNTKRAGFTGPDSTWPVPGATQQFAMYTGNSARPHLDTDKVYIVVAGANDVYFGWATGQTVNNEEFLGPVADAVSELVSKIAAFATANQDHVRVTIVVANLYPPEVTPWARRYASEALVGVTELYNRLLSDRLDALGINEGPSTGNNTGPALVRFDLSSFVHDAILTARETNGAKSVEVPCITSDYFSGAQEVCDDPTQHFFYDIFHPNSRVHESLSAAMLRAAGLGHRGSGN